MISVIILTKNKQYRVLDVPENGTLIIKEQHLLCGITQNGVKMLPYGPILSPFETFIWDNTLSVEMLPSSIWMPEGRVLDFSAIELLQGQFTTNASQSGSENNYSSPVFTLEGYPIDYNFRIKGKHFDNLQSAKTFFSQDPNAVVNAIKFDDATQSFILSVQNTDKLKWTTTISEKNNITEVEDLSGFIREVNQGCFRDTKIKTLLLPSAELIGGYQFHSITTLTDLYAPKLKYFGANAEANDFVFYNTAVPQLEGMRITVSRFMETSNAGALEGDLALMQGRGAIITFID